MTRTGVSGGCGLQSGVTNVHKNVCEHVHKRKLMQFHTYTSGVCVSVLGMYHMYPHVLVC